MENFKIMSSNNIYIVKSLAPWMVDELIAFSEIVPFKLLLLRTPGEFYRESLQKVSQNKASIHVKPFNNKLTLKKIKTALVFLVTNLKKVGFDYNGVLLLKSIVWFLRLDLYYFCEKSNIHAQFATQPSILALLIKMHFNQKPKYSFTFHAYDIYFENRWFAQLVNNAENAFSISEYNIGYISKEYPKADLSKVKLARLGVFPPSRAPNKSEEQNRPAITLGFVSWFVEKKGLIYLLKAMKMVKKAGLNIRLKLAGDGPLKDHIINFITENQLDDYVEYIGIIKGELKQNFFNGVDIFILPSITVKNDMDGVPVVLMEAVNYGLPLISTNVSGIPEICVDGKNGILVNEKNAEDLFIAIKRLSSNNALMKSFGEQSLLVAKRYDIRKNSAEKVKKVF